MLGNGDITIDEPPDVYIPFQLDPTARSMATTLMSPAA
jgi:hypothetical protein